MMLIFMLVNMDVIVSGSNLKSTINANNDILHTYINTQ